MISMFWEKNFISTANNGEDEKFRISKGKKEEVVCNPSKIRAKRINQSEKCRKSIKKLKSKKVFVGGKLK